MNKGSIVYSTNPDWKETCPVCQEPLASCVCKKNELSGPGSSIIKIRREKKGRGGKTVTTISGLPGDLKIMQKELQRLCGAGGTVRDRVIEIQGDQRLKIRDFLQGKGYIVKLAGG
jgi:translation initiation factor 1